MVVTRSMILKKMAELNRQSRSRTGTHTTPSSALEEEGTVLLSEQKIVKVQGDCVFTENNTKAALFSPIPGLHVKCVSPTSDAEGLITLRKPLLGLFIDDGSNAYCLGVQGVSDEFEVRLQVGSNEVRLNNLFLNLSAPHLVVNGVEVKDSE